MPALNLLPEKQRRTMGDMDPRAALRMGVSWRPVRSNVFPWAVEMSGQWWVLRLNDFPEHPAYTLFADGICLGDLDDLPHAWQLDRSDRPAALTAGEREQVLHAMRGLGPYGAEAGQPCDGDWCTCSIMTDELAAQLISQHLG